ncbi:MAG: hypothetical protein K2O15_04535, partial [Lachnospiraceae bacterium]|nr:hypothetical protein [Lachnospiraceae bacterium]
DRVVASRHLMTGVPEYIGREVTRDDCLRDHYDFSGDIGTADIIRRFDYCVAELSRQEKK